MIAATAPQLWLAPLQIAEGFDPMQLTATDHARWAGFHSARRQQEFLAGRALLAAMPAPEQPRCLSHGHGWVAAGRAPTPLQVGVDLEPVQARDWATIAARHYTATEQAQLAAAPDEPTRLTLFHTLWTVKEAAIKALNLEFHSSLQRIGLHHDQGRWQLQAPTDLAWRLRVYEPLPDWRLSLVLFGPADALAALPEPACRVWPSTTAADWPLLLAADGGAD